MSRRAAELTKYAGNAFLATKIGFINEIADLCEKVGADVRDVARGIGLDRRIGSRFLMPGPGYGGSCFPKDTLALLKTGQDFEAPLRIVESVVASNDNRKRGMGRKVIQAMGEGPHHGKTVAVLGLTFKANTDDMRDSPSISIIQALQDAGIRVKAFDPEGMDQAKKVIDKVTYCSGPYQAVDGADAVVIVTEWDAFRALDLDRMKEVMSRPVIVDLRNLYSRDDVERHGLEYTAVGR
jgi:UDPglucose 6-dehydrogenase